MGHIGYKLSTKEKNGECQIYIDILADRKTHYRLKSGIFITPENFNRLVKADRILSLEYLSRFDEMMSAALPCSKEEAEKILYKAKGGSGLIIDEFRSFYTHRMVEKGLTPGTMELYHSVEAILKEYYPETGIKMLDTTFLSEFIMHMTEKGLSNVTQHNYWSLMSVFIKYLYGEGMVDQKTLSFKPKFKKGDKDVVYLTKNELYRMMTTKLKGKDEKLKDAFIVQCMTGMRHSDLINIRKENIREDVNGKYVSILTKKTTQRLKIYLNSTVCEILEKYDYDLPVFSLGISNYRLPRIAKDCNITGTVETITFVGNERKVEVKEKWELVKTHVARRTHICLSIEAGISTPVIMATTGHRQLSSFQRYVKISDKKKSDATSALEI